MEVRDGLALDEHTPVDAVVTRRKRLDHDLRAKSLQARWNTTSLLEDVCGDDDSRSFTHAL